MVLEGHEERSWWMCCWGWHGVGAAATELLCPAGQGEEGQPGQAGLHRSQLGTEQPRRCQGGWGAGLGRPPGGHGEGAGVLWAFLCSYPHRGLPLLNKSWGQTQELAG